MSNVACIQKVISANPYRQGTVTLRANDLNNQFNIRNNASNTADTLINLRLSNRWSVFVTFYTA